MKKPTVKNITLLLCLLLTLNVAGCAKQGKTQMKPYPLVPDAVKELRYDSIYPEMNDPLVFQNEVIGHFVQIVNPVLERLQAGEAETEPDALLRFLHEDGKEVTIGKTGEQSFQITYHDGDEKVSFTVKSEELENLFNGLPEPVFVLRSEPITNSQTGYITAISDMRILVVSSELIKEYNYYNANWYSMPETYLKQVAVGQKVDIVSKGITLQSYPAQTAAKELYIYPDLKPAGVTISQSRAIQLALEQVRSQAIPIIPAITEITFQAESLMWNIQVINGSNVEQVIKLSVHANTADVETLN